MTNEQQPPYGQPQPPSGQQPQYGQPPYGQPQYGQSQPQYAQQAQGFIELTMQGSVMTSNMIVPTVTIDGINVPVRYGLNTVPVPAGPHHISVVAQWMRAYGQAEMDLTVQPGQHVPVFYGAPLHQFTTGSIGHEKQKRKGLGVMIGVLAAIVFLFVILPILLSL